MHQHDTRFPVFRMSVIARRLVKIREAVNRYLLQSALSRSQWTRIGRHAHRNARHAVLLLFVAAVVFIAFLPSLRNGFVNYDDDRYVYRNPLIRDFSPRGAGRIFAATDFTVLYTPMVFLSYAVEYRLFGPRAVPLPPDEPLLHSRTARSCSWSSSGSGKETGGVRHGAPLRRASAARGVSGLGHRAEGRPVGPLLPLGAALLHRPPPHRSLRSYRFTAALFLSLSSRSRRPSSSPHPALCDYLANGRVTRSDVRRSGPLACLALGA
jgi:hypothetical protein